FRGLPGPVRTAARSIDRYLPCARNQESLQSQARWRAAVSSSVSSSSKHRCTAKDCSGDDLSIRGRGCRHHRCPSPKNANASRSRRRITPVSRSDPALRFVRLRQRFVRWGQGLTEIGGALSVSALASDCKKPSFL